MDSTTTVDNVAVEVGDRVAAMHDGAMRKGRVAGVDAGLVGVTFAKGETPAMFNRTEIFPLYRHLANGTFPLCMLPVAK